MTPSASSPYRSHRLSGLHWDRKSFVVCTFDRAVAASCSQLSRTGRLPAYSVTTTHSHYVRYVSVVSRTGDDSSTTDVFEDVARLLQQFQSTSCHDAVTGGLIASEAGQHHTRPIPQSAH